MINKYDNLKEFRPRYTPVKHKRKVPFNPNIEVTNEFSNRIQRIRELDFELDRFVLTEKDYAELVLDAYSTNIHWSTKIEGNPLSQAEVKRVTRKTLIDGNIEIDAGPNQEIANHVLIFLNRELVSQEWNKEFICYLHGFLLANTETKAKIGEYRKGDCIVEEGGQLVFSTCPPGSIEEEMGSLIDWVNRKGPAYDPIVTASIFFHEFESIHPFEDGNGRLGRSLFHLYLMNHGLKKSNLCKIDYELLNNSSLYYNILAYTGESQNYTPLIELFSIAVLHSYESAVSSLSGKDLLSSFLDENSKRLIMKAKQLGDWFNIKEAVTWVDAIGEQPVRTRLNRLVSSGVLETKGKTKGLKFRFKVPFSQTLEAIKALGIYESEGQD
jgi:Fic family protein